jgi:hypothetical protein
LLNRIKELSFRANIEPVWNVKVCGTPVQLEFLELNYFSREEYGQYLPLEALLPVWQNAAKMSAGENQFSLTRAQSKPAVRQEAIP